MIINDLKPSTFISNNYISISQINGYGISAIGCNTARHKEIIDLSTNNYIGSKWLTTRIIFEENSIMDDFFGCKIRNISDFIDNVDSIELKLMKLSLTNYEYFINSQNDEVYLKLIKIADKPFKSKNRINENDTLFIFNNPDCQNAK